MKIRIQMTAKTEQGSNFTSLFTKAKAEVQQAKRNLDNAQAALDVAQGRLNSLVEQQLQRYAM